MEVTFEPTGLGKIIFRDRYARNPEETWGEACRRVAEHIAQAEINGKFKKYSDRFYEQLVTNKFNPGGRIWYGAGRPKAQLLNCFVIPTHDSREGWGRTTSDVIVISGLMGGVGINMSPIRPRGSIVKGTGGIATGAVSLMELINGVGDVIVGGGSRRMALMLALNINHPDLEEFLSKKLDRKQLNNANVSIIIPPDMSAEEFVSLVTENKEFELVFNGIPSGKTINARELWDKLVANAWESGEPGVLNGSYANKMNNIYYHKPLICTNPCVTGDTWVMTAGGPRRAVDLVGVETAIQTDGKFYSTKGFFKTGHKDVFTLNTREGYSVNLTPDHRVLLEDNHWVEAQDLRPGDKIVLNNHERAPSWQGHGVGEGFGSAYEGYLVGHFLGDGTWDYNRARLCSWGETEGEKAVRKFIGGDWKRQASGAYFRSDVTSISDYLEVGGTKTISDTIQTASSAFYAGFLRGLFDTDGHIEGSPLEGGISIRLSQSNYEFLADVQRMLLRMGIRSKINMAKEAGPRSMPDGHGGYKEYETKTNWRLIITSDCDRYMKYVGFVNADKTSKFNSLKKQMTRGFYQKPFAVTFESLEYIGKEDVYDVTVPDVHAFDANGLYVHNCGEIWLEEYGCCDLGSLVLPRFVDNGEFDWDALDETVRLAVRFLDNVLDINHYPLAEIKENCENVRRIGLGVMGLHTMLLELGMKYDSEEAFEFVDRLFNTIKNTAYDASINLAIEKVPFPAYDPAFLDSGFVKTLKRGIRNKIREHGIRNCALLMVAPTGTTSMLTEGQFISNDEVIRSVGACSSGLEPHAPPVYWRNFYKPNAQGERDLTRELVVEESFYKYPELAQSAIDVSVEGHFRMQKTVQKHVDNAVSKTINLAKDFPQDAFGDIWLQYLPYLKGTTVYRFGSRENEPIQPIPREQWDELIAKHKGGSNQQMSADEFLSLDCPDGVCELPQNYFAEKKELETV